MHYSKQHPFLAIFLVALALTAPALSYANVRLHAANTSLRGDITHYQRVNAAYAEQVTHLRSVIASETKARKEAQREAAALAEDNAELVSQSTNRVSQASVKQSVRVSPQPSPSRAVSKGSYTALLRKWFGTNAGDAAKVMLGESTNRASAVNGHCKGLFQQDDRYWADRLARTEKAYGVDLNDSIFNAESNIAVSAWLSKKGTDWSHWSVKP